MSIWAISDLHLSAAVDKPMDIFGGNWFDYWNVIKLNWKKNITEDDVVLIAGDISWAMGMDQAIPDLDDVGDLPGKKIIIRGNHDYWWNSISRIRGVLKPNFFALQNDAIKIGNFVFCGSRGWNCPDKAFSEEDEKIYKREVERMTLSVNCAKRIAEEGDTIVAMIHFPPFNVRREASGFTEIFERENIRTVVYGHIHGKNSRADKKYVLNGVSYYLTSCDQINNMPVKLFD